ncbi:hypothetical protein KM043_006063 [Ampulex compressa]|nr:hypothetical protein KM043_006063 [Ampulex compressa]
MEKPSKETINLLDLLSETDSDVSDLVDVPRRKKVKRRHKPMGMIKKKHGNSCGCSKSNMRAVSLWFAALLITFWLIALSWLATVFYAEIKKMDTSIKSESRPRIIEDKEGVAPSQYRFTDDEKGDDPRM